MNPYPAYRNSGVEWLEDVPAHWEVAPLGRIGRFFKGSGGTKADETEEGVPCVRYGDLYTHHDFHIASSRAYVARSVAAKTYTPIQFGDVLFAGSGETIDEIGKSAANLMVDQACCGGDVIVFRPSVESNARFLGYATDCQPAARQKARMGRGFTIIHIYGNDLKSLAMPIPPVPEQVAITGFLDHATSRIDRYIGVKKKLIALLGEQKRAIIHEAVTGQIDVRTGRPYSTYKPSGIEGLSDVPNHWIRMRLKSVLRSVDRRSTTGTETLLSLRREHGVVVYADHFTHPPQGETVGFKLVRAGELVVNRLQANNGLVFSSNINGLVSPDYSVFETKTPVQTQYLSDLVRTEGYRAYFRQEARGLGTGTSGFLRLYDDAFLNTVVHLPPLAEQRLILRTLRDAERGMNALIANVRRQLELMTEFRASLISNLVTGKLDVRNVAAELPNMDPFACEVRGVAVVTESNPKVAELGGTQELNP
ncbi:MAG: restriction endonuclease subunit S [Gammaproteobacteria bacterium]|nr:restriction endonuclease subunit S [Gammaproteobacteria bacterium]